MSAQTTTEMSAQAAPSLRTLVRIEADSAGAIDEVVPLGHHSRERVIALGQPIYVRGWAVDVRGRAPASRVVLLIDGVLEVPAVYGTPRGDIASVFGVPEYRKAGFEATVPPVLGLGAHNVAACAVSADGTSYVVAASAPFYVIPSLIPRPFLDAPSERGDGEITAICADGDTRSLEQRAGRVELAFDAGVTVSGWARPPRGSYAEAGIVVDDRWYLEASPSATGAAGAYEARFVLNFALPGDHELYAVARSADGGFVRVSERVPFESIEPSLPWLWPLIELRQPSSAGIVEIFDGAVSTAVPRGHAIFVRGWAIDEPAGAAAAGVYISIDGDRKSALPARYGRPTPEEARLPDFARNCGFTALIPTDGLAVGQHTIELLVVAGGWTGFYVPLPPVGFSIVPAAWGARRTEDKRQLFS
jgi:hypothetical protein